MSYFNPEMTREQAWITLYTLVDQKSKEEMKEIMEEYKAVLPAIVKKELSGPLAMTSYQISPAS